MMTLFLNEDTGVINLLVEALGREPQNFMGNAGAFRSIYVISGIWQSCGWSSIIYIAALSGVDIQLHEAARIDGANRLQRTWYVDLPSIMPTVITVLILNCGRILSVGKADFTGALRNMVYCYQDYNVNNRIEQADCGSITVLRPQKPYLVDICGYDFSGAVCPFGIGQQSRRG